MEEKKRERREERKREYLRVESSLSRGETEGIGIGRRAGDHHQVKSSRNAPANNLKFKLRAGLQI